MSSLRNRSTVALTCIMLLASCLFTGCGVMFNGTSQTLQINSSPDGAKISSTPVCGDFITPASISLERKNSYVLSFSKDGYEPTSVPVQKRIKAGIIVLDVLLTGVVGVVIDAATGGWYKLTPDAVSVTLIKSGATGAIDGPDEIEVFLDVSDNGDAELASVTSSEPGVTITVEKVD